MTKSTVAEWDASAGNNTDIGGVSLAEGCAPGGLNDAMREMMAQIAAGVPKACSAGLTLRVPSEYPTITAALRALVYRFPVLLGADQKHARILLESGFTMAEQVFVAGLDFSSVYLEAEDAEVTISRQALVSEMDGYLPAFGAHNGGFLPIIGAKFRMDATGDGTRRNGIFVTNRGEVFVLPGCGVTHAQRGLHIGPRGGAVARYGVFTDCSEAGIRNSNAGVLEARWVDVRRSGKGLMLAGNSITNANGADLSGCTIGVEAYQCAAEVSDATVTGCGRAAIIYGGRFDAVATDFDGATGADAAVEFREGATGDIRSSTIRNAAGDALLVSGADVFCGLANLDNAGGCAIKGIGADIKGAAAILTNAAEYGCLAMNGATARLYGADASGAGLFGFHVQDGGVIFANATAATGSTYGVPVNTLSGEGIIFQ